MFYFEDMGKVTLRKRARLSATICEVSLSLSLSGSGNLSGQRVIKSPRTSLTIAWMELEVRRFRGFPKKELLTVIPSKKSILLLNRNSQ